MFLTTLTRPNGSKIPLNISSVMLKCSEPTYNLIGPVNPLCRLLAAAAALFFSAWKHEDPISATTDRRLFCVCVCAHAYLGGLNNDRNSQQPLPCQSNGQRNRRGLNKLNVSNALRPARVPVRDHSDIPHLYTNSQQLAYLYLSIYLSVTCQVSVTYLADSREEVFQVSRSYPGSQLHTEDCASVSLFWSQVICRLQSE